MRPRLDQLLVTRGLAESRSRARAAIEAGGVTVDGKPARSASQGVDDKAVVTYADAHRFVGRGALKLDHALTLWPVAVEGRTVLDVGASTGGFTQVLLERGAGHVVALDVGHGQLHDSLRADPRVTVREGLNARDLTVADLAGHRPDMLVSDVSFISLTLALPPALDLAAPGALGVLLVKPQFEAGRAAIGKGGLLRDPADGPRVADDLAGWLGRQPGWRTLGLLPSPIAGGDGNREFLLAGVKDA